MKNSYFFGIIPFILYCTAVLAQNTQSASNTNLGRLTRNDWGSIMRGNQPMMTKKRENIELRGHPFFVDEWVKGALVISDTLFNNDELQFKLDVTDHEIWFKKQKGDPLVLIDKRIVGVDLYFKDSTISFRKIPLPVDSKENPWRYVQVLYGGENYLLYKYVQKEFLPSNSVDKGIAVVGRAYDAYEEVSKHYYIVNEKKQLRKIQLKRNDIYKANLALVEKNREKINEFCKEFSIYNPLDEQDAIELIRFIDSLK